MGNSLSDHQSFDVDIVVVGAGPTGLGAAYRLHQYKMDNWLLLDAEKNPGGLAGSITTAEGFRFDHGFQTLTSNYDYFDKVLEALQEKSDGKLFQEIKTFSAVLSQNKFIPYPIQDHLSSLPNPHKLTCATDLVTARLRKTLGSPEEQDQAENLNDYLIREWGEGLSNLFFRPYIYKSWAYPPEKMTFNWISRRIPDVDMTKVMGNLLEKNQSKTKQDTIVKYPENDGLGKLWKNVVDCLAEDCVHFKTKIKFIDIEKKLITTVRGIEVKYEHLISTIPLALLLKFIGKDDIGSSLESSSSYVVCLGMRGFTTFPKVTGCIYFPESNVVFHRACVFSSFDRGSVPPAFTPLKTMRFAKKGDESSDKTEDLKKGPYWSLMLEITCGPLKKVNKETIVDDAISDACSIGLLKNDDEIVSMHLIEMRQSCPLPKVNEEEKIKSTLDWLKSKDVLARGRCGAFSQQVAGIDDNFIQGVEAIDHILHGSPEHCLNGTFDIGTKLCMPKYHLKSESISTAASKLPQYSDDSELSSATESSSSSVFSDIEETESDDGSPARSYPVNMDQTTDSGLESRDE